MGLLIAAVSFAGLLAPLNSTMLAVALPDIRAAFGVGHAGIGWLVSAYLITMAVAQPVGGRIGDQIGYGRVFRTCLIGFLAFSLLAALAPEYLSLIAFRIGQALTGAALIPNGMAMVREAVPTRRLGGAFGLVNAVFSLAAATGPLAGAALLNIGNWRLLFLANVPVVLAALLLHRWLQYQDTRHGGRMVADWFGIAVFAGLLVAVTLSLSVGPSNAPKFGFALAGTAILAMLMVYRLRVAVTPVVEWRLFRSGSFAAATGHVLITNLVLYTTLLTIPFFLTELQHRGAGTSGLVLGAMSVLMAVVAPFGGRIGDAVGRRLPTMVGAALAAAGSVLLFAELTTDIAPLYLAVALGVLGLGVGLGTGAASTAAIEAAPVGLIGSASGTNSMMRYIGSILGAGLLAGILTRNGGTPDLALFRSIFAVVALMAVLSIIVATRIHRFPAEAAPAPTTP